MIDAFTIKGLSGNISAELLLPQGFDKEKDRCVLVLLLHGSWNPIIPVSCSKQYAKWYRNCSLNIIRATGHVFLLRRGKLVRLLMDYLRQFSL